jgi:hypothetical protein
MHFEILSKKPQGGLAHDCLFRRCLSPGRSHSKPEKGFFIQERLFFFSKARHGFLGRGAPGKAGLAGRDSDSSFLAQRMVAIWPIQRKRRETTVC